MGTRGYIVYRHKGVYFIEYVPFDAYLEGVGLETVLAIPIDPQEFLLWLQEARSKLDQQLKDWEAKGRPNSDEISAEQPRNDLFIEYVYELDLDRLVFHIDSLPLFRLDNVPRNENFITYTTQDHYGHRAFSKDTPQEHQYAWGVPAPDVSEDEIATYLRQRNPAPIQPVNQVLSLSGMTYTRETLRRRFMEVVIGHILKSWQHCILIHELESISRREDIPKRTFDLAVSLVNLFTSPLVYRAGKSLPLDHVSPDFMWARRDICVRIATHLDDEKHLQATVGKIVEEVTKNHGARGIVYGVGFSIFHCVIIRIDTDSGGRFSHTPPLQFLPDWYTESPSTPGITALASLCDSPDPDILQKVGDLYDIEILSKSRTHRPTTPILNRLPADITDHIAAYIHSPIDLLQFASVSDRMGAAASKLFRKPYLNDLRLLEPIKGDIIYQYPPELASQEEHPLYSGLYSGCFKVIDVDGNVGEIFLGSVHQYSHYVRKCDENDPIVKLPTMDTDHRSKRDWDINTTICAEELADSVTEL